MSEKLLNAQEVKVMLYTITIEVECEDIEAAKSFMVQAKEEILDACDADKGETVHTWKVTST